MITRFEKYLNKYSSYINLINVAPQNNVNKIITIPVFNELHVIDTCISIKQCTPPKYASEVILIINHSENTPPEIIKQNQQTFHELTSWSLKNSSPQLMFLVIYKDNLPNKHAGVGLARKLAMDEAVSRFSQINQEPGILISLDADTLVSTNYLVNIEDAFINHKNLNAALPFFEHQKVDNQPELQQAINQYELYLRYFKLALKYTGFPHSYHTIGSAFAVSANAYTKQGGMNKKQGGEDFYFLQKIFQLRNTIELKDTLVYPSSRMSDRVPFGTGPALKDIIKQRNYLTYRFKYFIDLKIFFDSVHLLYMATKNDIEKIYGEFPNTIQQFISSDDFTRHINEINSNCANPDSFKQRFFRWFNAFSIIKYLNAMHLKQTRVEIEKATVGFLEETHIEYTNTQTRYLLDLLKQLERQQD